MGNCCRKKNTIPGGGNDNGNAPQTPLKPKERDGNPGPIEENEGFGISQKTAKKGVTRNRQSADPGGLENNIKNNSKKDVIEIPQDEINEGYAAPGPGILPKIDLSKEHASAPGPNSDVFCQAGSLKKAVSSVDRSAEKMSLDNTLKEVPKHMPETVIIHDKESIAQVFTDDQLL